MSAAANQINGVASSQPPPNVSRKSPPHMTMNGSKPSPKEEKSIPGSGPHLSLSNASCPPPAPTIDTTATVKQRHPPYRKTVRSEPQSSDASDRLRYSAALSGGSSNNSDAAYCTEVARRSAARAALHLGVEGMEGAALEVLGNVLLDYMGQVGTAISTNVEASGRSSAHSNAYDALNAVELCTAPAATQILGSISSMTSMPDHTKVIEGQARFKEEKGKTAPDTDCTRSKMEGQELRRGWEGLASFLFGPDWFSIPLERDEDAKDDAASNYEANSPSLGNKDSKKIAKVNGQMTATTKKPGGKTILPQRPTNSVALASTTPKTSGKGKQLPNLIKGNPDKAASFLLERQNSGKIATVPADSSASPGGKDGAGSPDSNASHFGRWSAPYLDCIPLFPLVTRTEDVANPHRLPRGGLSISMSLHDLATEMEACREPPAAKRQRKGSTSCDQDARKTPTLSKAAWMREQAADRAMRAALHIPDDVYNTMGKIWGSIKNNVDDTSINVKEAAGADGNKKPIAVSKKATGGAVSKACATAKVKFDPSTKQLPIPNAIISSERTSARPSYIPNFLPPFPSDEYSDTVRERISASNITSAIMDDVLCHIHQREKRKGSPLSSTEAVDFQESTAVSERDAVRRSVIGLGKPVGLDYWGSKWLEDNQSSEDGSNKLNNLNTTEKYLSAVAVAAGEGRGTGASAAVVKRPRPDASSSQVAPLGRASGSRLSKILEGSMNVS